MLRRFRFGFLSLFAAMLLLVSAAGWWKFRRDLYVEEVEALKALRQAGLPINVSREKSDWAEAPEDEETIPWNAPLIGPLESLYLDELPTPELRDRALRLPRLKVYYESPTREQMDAEMQAATSRPVEQFDVAAFLGSEPPALDEQTLAFDLLDQPLPEGEPADEVEAARIAQAILVAWRKPETRPSRYLVHLQSEDADERRHENEDVREILFQESDRALRHQAFLESAYPERLSIIADGLRYDYDGRGESWRRESRFARYDGRQFRDDYRNFPDDEFPYHGLNFHNWRLVERAFDAMPRLELDRVEKIDDVRYRVDFAPFPAPPTGEERSSYLSDPKVDRWECVLRSDLGWAPEEVLLVQAIQYIGEPKPLLRERRMVQRFERRDGYVLVSERLQKYRIDGQPIDEPIRTRFATDLDPKIVDRAFLPATLDPEPWAEPRHLPALPWYRVTFVASLALFAFLALRSVASMVGRKGAASPAIRSEAEVFAHSRSREGD